MLGVALPVENAKVSAVPEKRTMHHPGPGVAARAPRGRHSGARAVGSFLPALTTKAFQRYGFSTVALITDWPAIVGSELARATAPERVKWRRSVETVDEEGGDALPSSRTGATLVLRVDGAKALKVQYEARQIIERINAYFGYAAIAELRLIQAPAPAAPRHDTPARMPAAPLTREVSAIAHPGLRDALARLGGEIRAVC
jgi:hypothetical protein